MDHGVLSPLCAVQGGSGDGQLANGLLRNIVLERRTKPLILAERTELKERDSRQRLAYD